MILLWCPFWSPLFPLKTSLLCDRLARQSLTTYHNTILKEGCVVSNCVPDRVKINPSTLTSLRDSNSPVGRRTSLRPSRLPNRSLLLRLLHHTRCIPIGSRNTCFLRLLRRTWCIPTGLLNASILWLLCDNGCIPICCRLLHHNGCIPIGSLNASFLQLLHHNR